MSNERVLQTATERVQALSESLTTGLRIGEQYVALLNELSEKADPAELLTATQKLTMLDLTSPFVKFPQHYHPEDYYLLFMGRLMDLANIQGMRLDENEREHRFSMNCQHLGDEVNFQFELDPHHGGAFFTEEETHESLFYINLNQKVINFSNRALINFFMVNEIDRYSDLDIQATLKSLIDFSQILESKLDFVVNLGILNTTNGVDFPLQAPELDLTIIDKLFVKTTDTDFMLLSLPHNNGAMLNLDRHIQLTLSYDPDDYSKQWKFQVTDPDQQYSFFDVLLHYEMLRDWYLDNRDALAVRSELAIAPEGSSADA
ncbi:hypothetical protein [Limosilactobacillus caecicola]|uniref:hypothetical protein n=1 Tax=Limosilactobacillus caecicola TaxID=2941332 RepID=UPI0020405A28|nr:hypothetical protein [Limosilactobacillus caecicola]